jgi:hypothetical protein
MSKRIKRFVVTGPSGIPFGNQTLMTEEECEQWIIRDLKDLHENCGLTDITRKDYGIFDLWGEYTIDHAVVCGEVPLER